MFIKKIDKKNNDNKTYTYFRLCESIRIGNKTRHHNLLNLGSLDKITDEERKLLANAIENAFLGLPLIFDTYPDNIKLLAVHFANQLKEKRKVELKPIVLDNNPKTNDFKEEKKEFEMVDLNSLQHEKALEIGAESLCFQAVKELNLPSFFETLGWDTNKINNALTLIISRAVMPASEYKTSQWLDMNTALTELLFNEHKKFNHRQLYKIGDELYKHKDELCNFLSNKTNELFNLTDKIIFYDLTNTYFEGRKVGSKLSKFGRSKEKRSDAKLVSLAMSINAEGFVKKNKIYSGNIFEAETLIHIIEELNEHKKTSKPLIVIDAGIATKDNLTLLKQNGYNYLCVTRSKLKDFMVSKDAGSMIEVKDNRGHKIELKQVTKPDCEDQYMYIKSEQKTMKEMSMESNYCKKFEAELDNLIKGVDSSKGRTKKIEKFYERLGRIKERYPRTHTHYDIQIESKESIVTKVSYKRLENVEKKEYQGVYFVRTSLKEKNLENIWKIYNTLTEIEATFRTLKSDLNIRPVYHQKDERTEAHIHLAILAYTIVNTIRYKLKQTNLNYSWESIVRIMNSQKYVTTTIKNKKGKLIMIKKCTQPNAQVLEIYTTTKYNHTPIKTKRYVVPH